MPHTWLDNYRILADLDFIFAKANLAKIQNGMAPIFNTEGRIRIRQGRHPLLDPKKVVPIDVHLGDTFHLLIITGPNTGGKTGLPENGWPVHPDGTGWSAYSRQRIDPNWLIFVMSSGHR